MNVKVTLVLVVALALTAAPNAVRAEPATAPSPASAPAAADVDRLRAALKSAYNKGDIEGMLVYLHPDAVIIFPDGRFLKGRAGLRDYYNRMLKGPAPLVASFTAEPDVQSRTVQGNVGLSYGLMNDEYVLTNGERFKLDSRFTVTLLKTEDGPADTHGWMIRSFHASTDAFDNSVLTFATRRVFWRAGIGGVLIGIVVGLIAGLALARRTKTRA